MVDPVVEQEEGRVLNVVDDVYMETSEFKGKQYASIRRWFKADDGKWYRTKNGLSILKSNMELLLSKAPELLEYMNEH